MKQLLFTNWHLMRFIRLILGVFLIFQGIEMHQWFFFSFAGFFLFQALLNLGCSKNGCNIPQNNKTNE